MKKIVLVCAAAVFAVALGCVIRTEHKIDAHITLDIRHIADQAENILDFVEGKTDTLPGMEETVEPVSMRQRIFNAFRFTQVAHAASLKDTSPLVTEIAKSMRSRNSALEALKRDGCVGETNRGLVELRDCAATQDGDKRNEAQKVVADENKDRQALYNEIARLNRDTPNVTVATVQAVHAMERLNRAKSGEIFQLPPAGENFDKFKNSAAGQRLGAKCQPGAWVAIP